MTDTKSPQCEFVPVSCNQGLTDNSQDSMNSELHTSYGYSLASNQQPESHNLTDPSNSSVTPNPWDSDSYSHNYCSYIPSATLSLFIDNAPPSF